MQQQKNMPNPADNGRQHQQEQGRERNNPRAQSQQALDNPREQKQQSQGNPTAGNPTQSNPNPRPDDFPGKVPDVYAGQDKAKGQKPDPQDQQSRRDNSNTNVNERNREQDDPRERAGQNKSRP